MNVFCVFSLESPHRLTQYTIFNMKGKMTLNYPESAAMGFFSYRLKHEFETAMVNEPALLEPLKFHCIYFLEKLSEHEINGSSEHT